MSESPPEFAIQAAVREASDSSCQKSKRGVVIYRAEDPGPGHVLSRGHNRLPDQFSCMGTEACRHTCNRACIHAEMDAIIRSRKSNLAGYEMLHIKVVDGQAVPSGPPSCWQCARYVYHLQVDRFWLLHEDGWKAYDGSDFYLDSLSYDNRQSHDWVPIPGRTQEQKARREMPAHYCRRCAAKEASAESRLPCPVEPFRPAVTPGLHRHYKGGLYEVVRVTHDSTNGREGNWMVEYWSVAKGTKHVRDIAQFTEMVGDVPRFRRVEGVVPGGES